MNPRTVFEPGTVQHWLTTGSEKPAAVWICPRSDNRGHAPFLKFTTDTGITYAVRMSEADLESIVDTADAIVEATHDEREEWIDSAAREIRAAVQHAKQDR